MPYYVRDVWHFMIIDVCLVQISTSELERARLLLLYYIYNNSIVSDKNGLVDHWKSSNEDEDIRQLSRQSGNLNNSLVLKSKFNEHNNQGKGYSDKPILSSSPPPSPKLSWSTIIGRTTKDAFGNPISDKTLDQIKRMRILDLRIESKPNKSLRQASRQILFLKDRLGLSDFVMEKITIFTKRLMKEGLFVDGL